MHLDLKEGFIPHRETTVSSVRNGVFLLKERHLGFKPRTGISNQLYINFLQNQNSVPESHGSFLYKSNGIHSHKGCLYISFYYKLHFNSHGYNHVCRQAVSGKVHVCPLRTVFRTLSKWLVATESRSYSSFTHQSGISSAVSVDSAAS